MMEIRPFVSANGDLGTEIEDNALEKTKKALNGHSSERYLAIHGQKSRPANRLQRRLSYSFFSKLLNYFSCLELPDNFEKDVGRCIGIDFGGTLTKVVFFQPDNLPETAKTIADFVLKSSKYGTTGERDLHLSFKSKRMKGTFHFIRFESSRTLGALKLFKGLHDNISVVRATGGGAIKYRNQVKDELDIDLSSSDEFQSLVLGLTFVLLELNETECYTYLDYSKCSQAELEGSSNRIRQRSGSEDVDCVRVSRPITRLFPFLIVNIGSGVSILKVNGPRDFERVSGTALGGSTFLGLCKLITHCKDFKSAMEMAEKGEDRNINLLVEDIYGGPLILPSTQPKKTMSNIFAANGSHNKSSHNLRPERRSLQEMPEPRTSPSASFVLKGAHIAAFFGKLAKQKLCKLISLDNEPLSDTLDYANFSLLILLSICCAYVISEKVSEENYPLLFVFAVIPVFAFFLIRFLKSDPVKDIEKASMDSSNDESCEIAPEDVAKALVGMISQNITQIAYMSAKMHNVHRVVFTGSFLRSNEVAQIVLSRNIKIWSSGEVSALFVEHEGYFGALGSFLSESES